MAGTKPPSRTYAIPRACRPGSSGSACPLKRNDYIRRLEFIKSNEALTSEFFKYCFILKKIKNPEAKDSKVISIAKNIFESNILGPICFVTPELGRWSTVGGLGVMVDELSQGLRALGQEIIMISWL